METFPVKTDGENNLNAIFMVYCYRKHTHLHWLVAGVLIAATSCICKAETPAVNAPAAITDSCTLPDLPAIDYRPLQVHLATLPKPRREVNVYDLPYSTTANHPNYRRLAINTGALYVAGIAALGVLQSLPEDATAWNKERITSIPFWKRWSTHVGKGPVWDGDNFIFDYVLHPYGGAAYYMSARSSGCNIVWSALYSAAISAFFWEYGIEAFMEVPSLQDLIITPFAGSLIGESFYLLKRHIVSHGYTLFGSRLLGNVVAFIVDPVNEVVGLFAGNPCRKASAKLTPSPGGLTLSVVF